MYPVSCILSNTLRNPSETPDLLFLELHVRVEHCVLELLQERLLVEMHLVKEEPILELGANTTVVYLTEEVRRAAVRVLRPATTTRRRVKEGAIFRHRLARSTDLIDIVRTRKLIVALREETTDGGEESGTLLFRELCAEGVDGDVYRTTVSLKGEDAGHDFSRWSTEFLTEGVKVFQVSLVKGVPNNFNVEVIEFGCRKTFTEETS